MFIIAVFAISSLTDPYLGLQQPLLSHAVNALVFYTVSLVILFLTGRILVSLSILTALALVLRYAEKTNDTRRRRSSVCSARILSMPISPSFPAC
jgi:hypothetical protein